MKILRKKVRKIRITRKIKNKKNKKNNYYFNNKLRNFKS